MVFEKGRHHTKKTIELMKQNHTRPWLGRTMTEEAKQKKRDSMKEWWENNKNNPQTLERNKKIGLKRKGILHTEEAKEKISIGHLGFKHTQESKDKMSESRKGYKFSKERNRKISEARKGKPLSESAKQKLSLIAIERWKDKKYYKQFCESRIGEKNPNWQGGIQYEPYDNNWNRKFKNLIRKRDNQICMNCNKHREKLKYALDVHHINYDKKLSIKENCISLCHRCHSLTQVNRKHWIKFYQNLLSEKYGYKYSENGEIIFDFKSMKGGITKNVK